MITAVLVRTWYYTWRQGRFLRHKCNIAPWVWHCKQTFEYNIWEYGGGEYVAFWNRGNGLQNFCPFNESTDHTYLQYALRVETEAVAADKAIQNVYTWNLRLL